MFIHFLIRRTNYHQITPKEVYSGILRSQIWRPTVYLCVTTYMYLLNLPLLTCALLQKLYQPIRLLLRFTITSATSIMSFTKNIDPGFHLLSFFILTSCKTFPEVETMHSKILTFFRSFNIFDHFILASYSKYHMLQHFVNRNKT